MVRSLLIALVGMISASLGVYGHICMWAPLQRNGYSIDTPGESLCYLKEGPCGGVASAEPTTTLYGGKAFSVLFQQNLNHYYIENPGKLVVDFADKADPAEEDFTVLGSPIADYNAMNEITQTNFTINVIVPNINSDHGVIRLRYLSQNPTENDRGTTFYQCADVKIVKRDTYEMKSVEDVKVSQPTNSSAKECCAPKQFTLSGYETGADNNHLTTKKFYFDAVNRLFRVDYNSGSGVTPKDGHFQMYSNFTSGIEYYYNVNENSCGLYGLNYWSDWCYGAANQQTYTRSFPVGSNIADVWEEKDTPFIWTNLEESCTPLSMSRKDSNQVTFYYGMTIGQPDSSNFVLPSACKRSLEALTEDDIKKLPKSYSQHHQEIKSLFK